MAKYEYWLTDDGLLEIKGWAREGNQNKDIAKRMGIAFETFSRWKKKYSQIDQALKKGREPIGVIAVDSLILLMEGQRVTETKRTVRKTGDGPTTIEQVEGERYIAPSLGAICFYLKTQKKEFWSELSLETKKKLDAESKKAMLEVEKMEEELKAMRSADTTNVVIVDEWSAAEEEDAQDEE